MNKKDKVYSFRVKNEKAKELDLKIKKSGMTNTEYFLCCFEENPVIVLEEGKKIAMQMAELCKVVEENNSEKYEEGVEEICLLLRCLMEKIS